MGKEIIAFGDIDVEKCKFFAIKQSHQHPQDILDVGLATQALVH